MDIDPQFKPDLVKDILELKRKDLPKEIDFIWASPPCTTFSVASIRHYWDNGKPKSYKTFIGLAIVKKTLELIEEIKKDNPKVKFVIENPRGMLRKQDFIKHLKRDTLTYCQYGAKTQKPTDLFNNLEHKFKPMCKPGADCHEKASRGARAGVQGINNSFSNLGSRGKILRAVVPPLLCEEVIKHLENKPPLETLDNFTRKEE